MNGGKESLNLKAKLGLNVFKENKNFHISVNPGKENDPRLFYAVLACPAGLYSVNDAGAVELSQDGCLECGTCKIICSDEVLTWRYPDGATGVQFRFG
ncbi:MAG: 4Fe-4S dicluster domain-containing protein [Gracilibacteraceae bacterium]|jgi:ferredoxin like protein|nr:4Fe-4S dicluster domain-containing protein [Gracilibacteraceae bacterium]